MEEQKFVLENKNSFNIVHIFECGQCFRWNRQEDDSYTGVFGENVLNVKEYEDKIIFKGICNGNIKDICYKYFDLNTNYKEIKLKLSKIDDNIKRGIEYGKGIRILNQDLWECIISFITSANNNIPRIKKIIEKLCQNYGREIKWNNCTYYTFPTPQELGKATIQDLRSCGLGFRDKRIYETTKMINNGEVNLENLKQIKDVLELREKLLLFPGVGEKVADCIMLFSLKRYEVFPIDVWVRRVMNELYIKQENEEKVKKEEIRKLAQNKYGNLAGLAQQYLFYWKRDIS